MTNLSNEGKIIMTSNIPDHLMARLSKFINSKMGLYFPESRWNELKRSMADVALEMGFENDLRACVQHLVSAPLAKKQIDILAKHLTIGETYFFRDKKLFHTLEQQILRKLIDSRRTGKKDIRIWSAGCCTGEEPYSLAILIDQMIPARQDWDITLIGTDINTHFLQKAEKGIYTSWSFRDMPEGVMKKYFKKADDNRFEICEPFKKMVKFHQLNLVGDSYPSFLNKMDIIFCRNVLMYFEPVVRNQIIEHFVRSLSKNAWLVFSPSESPCIRHTALNPVQFKGVTLYRKVENKKMEAGRLKLETGNRAPGKMKPANRNLTSGIQNPISSTGRIQKREEKKQNNKEPRQGTDNGEKTTDNKQITLYQKALTLAGLGKLDEAEKWCRQAIQTEKLNPGHHYLLATIYQEQGRMTDSAKSFRHALFLDPDFVLAHFSMGNLKHREGKYGESAKYLQNALSLLLTMDTGAILPYSEGLTAGNLLEVVQSMIVHRNIKDSDKPDSKN